MGLQGENRALRRLLADVEKRDTRRLDAEYDRRVRLAHLGELEEVLGLAVGVRADVEQHARIGPAVGSTVAMAGRFTPLMRPITSVAAAMHAPVEPAEKNASARPSRTSRAPTTIEESFLERTALAGWSPISMISVVATASTRPPDDAANGSTTSARAGHDDPNGRVGGKRPRYPVEDLIGGEVTSDGVDDYGDWTTW